MELEVDIEKKLGGFCMHAKWKTNGRILGLLGESGCGKSMTLKCIAGIEKPDRGRIVLDGVTLFDAEKRICLTPQQRRIGYLFQNYGLFPNMTVLQNILCGLKWQKDRKKRLETAKELMDMMRLSGLENQKPYQLSGGQAQRTALARTMANQPKLLLLDEPFSALDSHLRCSLQLELLELLNRFQKDALLVTHSRDEAYHMCQEIAVMDQGQVLELKETKELFASPQSCKAAALTGCKNIAAARKIGERQLEVPDWGVTLCTEAPLKDQLCAVGIRTHYFQPKVPYNRVPVTYVYQVEEPFEWNIQFRFAGQKEGTPNLWWRIPKDRKPDPMPKQLGVAPVNVLPLYT